MSILEVNGLKKVYTTRFGGNKMCIRDRYRSLPPGRGYQSRYRIRARHLRRVPVTADHRIECEIRRHPAPLRILRFDLS